MTPLKQIRKQIDEIDDQIINLLNQRFNVTDNVANYKKTKNKVLDAKREEEIIAKIKKESELKNISSIEEVYIKIMELSKKRQEKLINED